MDLTNPKLIYLKAGLFVFSGALAAGLLVAEHPTLKTAALLAIAIWCFARAYYFAFYVIEHYVDPSFKFAGLSSFVRYLARSEADRVRNDAKLDHRFLNPDINPAMAELLEGSE